MGGVQAVAVTRRASSDGAAFVAVRGSCAACVTTRPFRAPHHTISDVGLIGGGQVPTPGEVSLTPQGVLCLDERPACRRHVPEMLRQPLEEGVTEKLPRGRPQPACIGGKGLRQGLVAARMRQRG
jgi:predicted ATPase with chaperone activity